MVIGMMEGNLRVVVVNVIIIQVILIILEVIDKVLEIIVRAKIDSLFSILLVGVKVYVSVGILPSRLRRMSVVEGKDVGYNLE